MGRFTRRTHMQRRWFALAVTGLLLVACAESDDPIPVSLHPMGEENDVRREAPRSLRVGIGAMISPATTMKLYRSLVEEIGRQVGKEGVPVQRGSYGEVNDLLEQKRLDCAFVCTGAYVAGRRKFAMELLVVPVFAGSPTYHSVIITREDSGIRNFEELRGKRFAFVDPLSNTGRFYPISRILQLGASPGEFFDYQYTQAHDNSIRAVRAGVVDGAAVDELIFDYLKNTNPGEVRGLRVIDRSPAYGAPPVVVHPDLSDGEKSALRRAFLLLTKSGPGGPLLKGMGVDRFVVPPTGLYDSAVELEGAVRRAETKTGGR